MKNNDFKIQRLKFSLCDFRSAQIAYPILADHGFMERTANGFVVIDPNQIESRTRELISQLEKEANALRSKP